MRGARRRAVNFLTNTAAQHRSLTAKLWYSSHADTSLSSRKRGTLLARVIARRKQVVRDLIGWQAGAGPVIRIPQPRACDLFSSLLFNYLAGRLDSFSLLTFRILSPTEFALIVSMSSSTAIAIPQRRRKQRNGGESSSASPANHGFEYSSYGSVKGEDVAGSPKATSQRRPSLMCTSSPGAIDRPRPLILTLQHTALCLPVHAMSNTDPRHSPCILTSGAHRCQHRQRRDAAAGTSPSSIYAPRKQPERQS